MSWAWSLFLPKVINGHKSIKGQKGPNSQSMLFEISSLCCWWLVGDMGMKAWCQMTNIHETNVLDASTPIAAYQLENKLMWKGARRSGEYPLARLAFFEQWPTDPFWTARVFAKWMETRPAGNSAYFLKRLCLIRCRLQCRCHRFGMCNVQLSNVQTDRCIYIYAYRFAECMCLSWIAKRFCFALRPHSSIFIFIIPVLQPLLGHTWAVTSSLSVNLLR